MGNCPAYRRRAYFKVCCLRTGCADNLVYLPALVEEETCVILFTLLSTIWVVKNYTEFKAPSNVWLVDGNLCRKKNIIVKKHSLNKCNLKIL